MSKKKKKMKHRRSQASKRRRELLKEACKGQKGRSPFIPASEMDKYPQIHEIAHSYRVCDLGSADTPGLLGQSLASYIGDLRKRVVEGERVKPNVFIQFGYSKLSVNQWAKKKEMHASGGANIPTMYLVVPDTTDSAELVKEIEHSVRDTVARLNENDTENIRTVHLCVDETNEEQDPLSAFGVPKEIIDPDGHIVKEIPLSI
jgi:hypothetical protein